MGPLAPMIKRAVAACGAVVVLAAVPAAAQDAAPELTPEPAPESAPDRAEREADLLRQLREADSPEAASLIESELAAIWGSSGSAAVDLLLRRGQDALAAGDGPAAIEHLTAAIDHDPAFAEAHVARAAAFYLTGLTGPAIDDLGQALSLNPNQWQAMAGFAVLLEEIGRPEQALEVWRRAADINPQSPEAQAAVERLALEVEGQAI